MHAMLRALVVSVLGFLFLGACGSTTPYYDYSKEPDPRKAGAEYVIGVSDDLEITVWKNPDLSTKASVRPDGTITLPLIGDVAASGHTPSQLKADITARLASFVKDEAAVVTVAVTHVNSYRFTVNGNVEHPGMFSSTGYVTVAEAVALAGGPNKYASPSGTVIIRSDAKGRRRIPIDYDAVRAGLRPEANLVVIAGDTIYMP
jgi:polysaccharide export outer membrane protein